MNHIHIFPFCSSYQYRKFDDINMHGICRLRTDDINRLPDTCTVMILSFRTDMSGQTVQTQIRLLLRVYTVCHSVCIVRTHNSMVEPHSSNFRVITTNILGVPIFRKFTVWQKLMAKSQEVKKTTDSRTLAALLRLDWYSHPIPI